MLACCAADGAKQFFLAHTRPDRRRSRQARVHARVSILDSKPSVVVLEPHASFHERSDASYYEQIRYLEASYQQRAAERTQHHTSTASLVPSAGPGHAHARQLRRARRTSRSATETHVAAAASLDASEIGGSNAQALVTVLDLMHLLQQEQQADARQGDPHASSRSWWQQYPPRLLTAAEERVLGGIVQQHRKLQQLYTEHPDIAATLPTLHTCMQTEDVSSTQGIDAGAGSSSSSEPASKHHRTTWPPKLTEADVDEVCSFSIAWRILLPDLATRAQHLLVAYNVKLLTHMRKFAGAADHVSLHDHVHAGLIGLKIAAQRYDPSRNTRFSTVASTWILAAMNRAASKQAFTISQPARHWSIFRHVLDKYGHQVAADIEQHPEVTKQVSDHFHVTPRSICRIVKSVLNCQGMGSLDIPSYQGSPNLKGQDSPLPWSAMVTADDLDEGDTDDADSSSSGLATEASYHAAAGQMPAWLTQQQQVPHSDEQLMLQNWLSLLTPQEQQVMLASCGFDELSNAISSSSSSRQSRRGRRPARAPVAESSIFQVDKGLDRVSHSKIGRQLGLTPQRVQQVKASALRKLQTAAGVPSSISSSNSKSSSSRKGRSTSSEGVEADVCCKLEDLPQATVAAIASCPPNCRKLFLVIYTFYSKQGRMPTGSDCFCDRQVGRYCDQIVVRYAKGRLQKGLTAVFEAVAPGWLDSKAAPYKQQQAKAAPGKVRRKFDVYYAALEQFVKENKRLPRGGESHQGLALDRWIHQQRYSRQRMSVKRRQLLEALPGWCWPDEQPRTDLLY